MSRIVEYHDHKYARKSGPESGNTPEQGFNLHLLSIQKRLGKVVARDGVFTVVFVGETHNTMDERRRASVFGNRPSSPALLTVLERGMQPVGWEKANAVAERHSALGPFDPIRDDEVVAQMEEALLPGHRGILILFGEAHEKKLRERMVRSTHFGGMIWHFYPSFNDHAVATHQVFLPHDPRGAGFELVGMIRQSDHAGSSVMNLKQLAEGVMPKRGPVHLSIFCPFTNPSPVADYALFARAPLLAGIQNGLNCAADCQVQVSWDNLRNIKVLNISGSVGMVSADLKDARRRRDLIEEFWADAA